MQLENQGKTTHAGLYIHVPFCLRKCPYCDFYSITDLREIDPFVDVLLREMDLVTMPPEVACDTLYIGGGTPSLLTPAQLTRILQRAYTRYGFTQGVEVTLEMNPGTVSLDSLKAFTHGGVNRVNLGIQSFDDRRLEFLGRVHSAQEGRQAIRLAREAGIENLGIDLMYGLPNQGAKGWLKDLEEAVSYEPEHLSCYMLTYEKGTLLDQWRKASKFRVLDEEAVRELFELTIDFLSSRGYDHYEISNFARKKAFRSRHNQKYWCHSPYTGLGPSAHSFVWPKRWWNLCSVSHYFESLTSGELPVEGMEDLSQNQLMVETVFLGLRTSDGVDTLQFKKRYKVDFFDLFGDLVERLEAQGLLAASFDKCALTLKGMLLSDTVSGLFADHVGE
ncbi:MAG: radical SAM family heme chaperone HemW [Thermodesulfobacteriota bacterium]|nr:radical SAM family heme chaperone HemW [Thermodesulfobacteriota bacterium]